LNGGKGEHIRCENANEKKYRLWIRETDDDLSLIKMLVLDSSLVASNAFDGKKALAVAEEMGVGWRIGHEYPNYDGPETGCSSKLSLVNSFRFEACGR
jgi:hypothetical protein